MEVQKCKPMILIHVLEYHQTAGCSIRPIKVSISPSLHPGACQHLHSELGDHGEERMGKGGTHRERRI
jgi:hypothetical protein